MSKLLAIAASLALTTASASPAVGLTVQCPAAAASPAALPATIPIDVWNNHVYVKTCVAGRELDFILDTGAGATSLDLNTAKQLGVRLGQSFAVGGAGAGTVAGARVEGVAATLQGASITQPIVLAIDLSRLPPREGHRMDGILGYDFIERNVIAIDYARRELRIYDRDAFRYDGPGVSVPITLINRFPHIDAAITLADGETLTGRFVIDVGASSALTLTKPFVDEHRLRDRVGPTFRRRGSGGVGGMTTTDFGRVPSLVIGSVELSRPIVQLFGDSGGVFSRSGPWIGNIGGSILRRFTLFLDYQRKRMIFEPNAAFAEPFEADMSGAALILDDSLETILVDRVEPSSPAAEAGLVAGDTVVSVDGGPAGQRELGELRERRFRREGERVLLTVRRGGETRKIEIVMRRLVAAASWTERAWMGPVRGVAADVSIRNRCGSSAIESYARRHTPGFRDRYSSSKRPERVHGGDWYRAVEWEAEWRSTTADIAAPAVSHRCSKDESDVVGSRHSADVGPARGAAHGYTRDAGARSRGSRRVAPAAFGGQGHAADRRGARRGFEGVA